MSTDDQDPREERNKIMALIEHLQAEVVTHAQASAAAVAEARQSAIDVAAEAKQAALDAASDVKNALQKEIATERQQLAKVNAKLDTLGESVSKLASAKLLQQAFTSLVLAGFVVVLIKVLGG